MSTFTIPNKEGQIRQDNTGDTRGELWSSYNLDLSSIIGKIKIAKKLKRVLEEADDLDSSQPQALAIYDDNFFLATDDFVYKCGVTADVSVNSNWSKETEISGTGLSFSTDMVTFGGLLLLSQSTDITSWNGSTVTTVWWTSIVSGSALTTGYPHIMHVHRGGQETLFITDKNLIRYYNATAGHSTITLQTDLVATCVNSGVNAIWAGTYTTGGGSAYVYEMYVGEQIDSVPVARNAYPVDGRAVLSIDVIDNIPYILTDRGHIQAFTGAGFKTVASFPFAQTKDELDDVRVGNVSVYGVNRPVHPKGMQHYGESLYININTNSAGSNTNAPLRSPSGVWEYNKTTGNLSHRYALNTDVSSYGEYVTTGSGPLLIVNTDSSFLLTCGDQGNKAGLYTESTETNQGYFTTPEIMSQTVADAYESAYVKAKTLATGESIKLKYRTVKFDKEYADVAFAEANKINTTDTLTHVAIGDEVTIETGANAGMIAHITDIQPGTSTTSIMLDTNIGTIGDSVRVAFENWKLHPSTYTTSDAEHRKFGIGVTSPWIQYKVVGLGDIEMRQFISKGNAKEEL